MIFFSKLSKFLNNRESTFSNYFWRVLQVFGKEGVSLYIFFVASHFLGVRDFGLYNYTMSFIFLLIMFGDFGISAAASKFTAEFKAKKTKQELSILYNSTLIILFSSLVVVGFALMSHRSLNMFKLSDIALLLPLVFFVPFSSLCDGVYRGLNRFSELTKITILTGIPFVPISYYLISNYGVTGAYLAQLLYYILLSFVLVISIGKIEFIYSPRLIKNITKYSLVIGVTSIGYYLFTRINVLILGHFGLISEISYYELFNKLFAFCLLPYSILSQVIAPKVTTLNTLGLRSDIVSLYKKTLLTAFSTSFVVVICVLALYKYAIIYLFNSYNSEILHFTVSSLIILLISQSMSQVASSGFSTAQGNASINMYFLLFFGVINLILSYYLVGLYGYNGIIYSTLFVKICADTLFLIVYYRKLKHE